MRRSNLIEEKRPDIVGVLKAHGAKTVPTRSRGWAAMKCPYHDDSDASASVNVTEGRFRCHACGVAGDAWDLICEHDRVTLKAALNADRYQVAEHSPTRRDRRDRFSI
jgi:DNA primase